MTLLAALDPGTKNPAVAIARGGLIVSSRRVKLVAAWAKLETGARVQRIGDACVAEILRHGEPGGLVYERPQFYQRGAGKSKGDPNKLALLALVSENVHGRLAERHATRIGFDGNLQIMGAHLVRQGARALDVAAPLPAEWIGGLPKDEDGPPWASPRGIRIRSRLSDAEFAAIEETHDAVDAAGLALWRLGRLERRRVFPGASRG